MDMAVAVTVDRLEQKTYMDIIPVSFINIYTPHHLLTRPHVFRVVAARKL